MKNSMADEEKTSFTKMTINGKWTSANHQLIKKCWHCIFMKDSLADEEKTSCTKVAVNEKWTFLAKNAISCWAMVKENALPISLNVHLRQLKCHMTAVITVEPAILYSFGFGIIQVRL